MSLPVSQYEALLAEVRGLRRKAQRVQQLATPLISNITQQEQQEQQLLPNTQDGDLNVEKMGTNYDGACEDGFVYHITSEPVNRGLWGSDHVESAPLQASTPNHHIMDVESVISFASSSGGMEIDRVLNLSRRSSQQLEAKVDMVYSLLAMLSGQEHANMNETLLALSTNPESCLAMRQSGCIPLLVQMVQSDKELEARQKAAQALHNLIYSQPDEKTRKREVRIFKLLEHARAYTEALKSNKEFVPDVSTSSDDGDKHPVQTIAHLMKLSFDEGHRQAICLLGGIHTIANLVVIEHAIHGSITDETQCILLRRYACMALTNLTFGDSVNKTSLCLFKEFMRALVVQLQSPSDELRQVTASVLRNLSWRPESCSKGILREVGSVTGLMKAAMLDNKENTLKSILSALWNLSAHCTENKSEICAVEGALGFLVDMLTYKTPSKSLAIIENAGGILRNISSQIAVRDDYREILREHNCLQILLDQLKSPSLTIVSNACGTLWNLSAKCTVDQEALWRMGAPAMLRSLNHSKHKMIAMGSSAALKNLLNANPTQTVLPQMDSTALAMDLPALPTLGARRQKALLQDLDQTLSETFDNIEKNPELKSITTNDFIQREKNLMATKPPVSQDYIFSYEDDEYSVNNFASLNVPSTSYSNGDEQKPKTSMTQSSGSSSLPYMEVNKISKIAIPIRNKHSDGKFLKSKPKNIAKSMSSGIECSSRSETRNGDSMAHSLDYNSDHDNSHYKCSTDSSCSSFDNDKQKREESDEKDRCSIEDIFDGDFPSPLPSLRNHQQPLSINYSLHDQTSVHIGTSRFETHGQSSAFNTCDLDDIHMDILSIDRQSDEQLEKQDVGKENDNDNVDNSMQINREQELKSSLKTKLPIITGIPVSKVQLLQIQSSSSHHEDTDISNISNQFKLSTNSNDYKIQSSTPIKLTTQGKVNDERHNERVVGGSSSSNKETSQVSQNNIMQEDMSGNKCRNITYDSLCTCPSTHKSLGNLQIAPNQDTEELNISQENNSSEIELKLLTDTAQPSCSYLNSDFALEKNDRDRHLERSCEETNCLDNRMLDPDAMIESIERFTAELVSQASHLQSKDDKYSKITDNTWNDDTSMEITYPSESVSMPQVVTFESSQEDSCDNRGAGLIVADDDENERKSNDFDSINTSTMTESTLIAFEANKMATVFKTEADMMKSITSHVPSLELDRVQPPSNLNSLNNSPKLNKRKKSLPSDLIVRRVLIGSINNDSMESLTNLDHVNPPSGLMDILDMENSLISVASLPSGENDEIKADFVINGPVNNRLKQPEYDLNQPLSLLGNQCSSISNLEMINPPSLYNEISDLCNSLADIATETIGTETEQFEDCFTHVNDPTIQTENDVTEFSDANSITPIQSDPTSPEDSPKRTKMTSKERRNLAKDRYKTYTIPVETLKSLPSTEMSDDCKTEEYHSVMNSESTFASPTYTVLHTNQDISLEKIMAKSPQQSPSKTKQNIRKNFLLKRLENKDRFKTQILPKSTLLDRTPTSELDVLSLVQKEANKIVNHLQGSHSNDFLDCETLSLVSNDDDSENNSGNSTYNRTYHKSWGLKKNIPIIASTQTQDEVPSASTSTSPPLSPSRQQQNKEVEVESGSEDEDEEPKPVGGKPKIVKPDEKSLEQSDENTDETQAKAIRGRRKPLYTKSAPPVRTIPKSTTSRPMSTKPQSNLVKNITETTTSKLNSPTKSSISNIGGTSQISRASSGYGTKPNSPKTSPARTAASKTKLPLKSNQKLDRQGTFTKDNATIIKNKTSTTTTKSRIPPPRSAPSKIPSAAIPSTSKTQKSPRHIPTSTNRNPSFQRSISDSRDKASTSSSLNSTPRLPQSSSNQNLKNPQTQQQKPTSIPLAKQKSNSNTNLTTDAGTTVTKQVTSRIASLWKKIEKSKKQQPIKKDTRVWIQSEEKPLVRTNTFDNKDAVVLRQKTAQQQQQQQQNGTDPEKRISRLGSFIVMNENEERLQQMIAANAVVD